MQDPIETSKVEDHRSMLLRKLDLASTVVAPLDELFSHEGIGISGDGITVILTTHGHGSKKHRQPSIMPRVKNAQGLGKSWKFESAEHVAIGDQVILRYSQTDIGQPASQTQLNLPNGLRLTYGLIVALGGDFYGIPNEPISDGQVEVDEDPNAKCVERFIKAFNSLATNPDSVEEAKDILHILDVEISKTHEALIEGRQVSEVYEALGDSLSCRWNVATGGGCHFGQPVPFGRYVELASTNWDHFGKHAILAYKSGHMAAIDAAIAAGKADTASHRGLLEIAYAMNAFADHFLTDLFAAGHLRSPRKELYETATFGWAGSYLVRYMHDEDNKFGLAVTNGLQQKWRTYGDKRYFDSVDAGSHTYIKKAVEVSVQEVFDAFISGNRPPAKNYKALQLVPRLDSFADPSDANNISPMFYWNGDVVKRRSDLWNVNDYTWKRKWDTLSTFSFLKTVYSPNKPHGFLDPPTLAPSVVGWVAATSGKTDWNDTDQVRYCFSIVNGSHESYPGLWSDWSTVSKHAFAHLTVPLGDKGAAARRIFRQFSNRAPTLVGEIHDNTTTQYIDTAPRKTEAS